MINILITAVGGDIGQGLLKSIRLLPDDVNIIGTDINADAPGLYMCNKGYLVSAALEDGPKYLAKVIDICQQENIKIVFSCHEAEQMIISRYKKKLERETNASFIVQDLPVTELCNDKMKTDKFLRMQGIRATEGCNNKDEAKELIKKYGFPLIIKSNTGSGSRYFHLLKNVDELEKYWLETPNPILQEYITNDTDDEYTVGIFLDKNSKSLGSIVMLRKLRFGLTSQAIVDDYPGVATVAERAAESIGAIGPCNVQLRMDKENNPCVIEINPRISSTAVFRAKLGFNEAKASIDYFVYNKKPELNFKKAVVMKIWDELIISREKYNELKKNNFVINP